MANVNCIYILEDAHVSARGGKTARLKTQDGSAVILSHEKTLVCPLGPGNLDKTAPAARMNLNVRMGDCEASNCVQRARRVGR